MKKAYSILAALVFGALVYGAVGTRADDDDHVRWTRNGAPTETYISGGGWTLEQSGAANGLKSAGYCDGALNQIGNPEPIITRMEPYYFPVVHGYGKHLQGYFDYRPKDIDEAVAAAFSEDGGFTWTFQEKVLELTKHCPDTIQKEADGETEKTPPDPNNSDNSGTGANPGTGDDGQGHQFVITINGHTYLYTLERAVNHIDADQLYIHEIHPIPGSPLNGAPALGDGPDDTLANNGNVYAGLRTIGLKNPDGILGVVPGSWPLTIIYEQKILSGDNTGPTAFAAKDQCNTFWASYYATNPFGTAVNDDITFLRLAKTTDGINFTDLGPLQGLNDPHDVSITGTRWLATAGTILALEDGRFGLLFSGGGCIDGDSDAFQYIGYAESDDLLNWQVINGINNPIVHTAPYTLLVNASGVPDALGTSVTVPKRKPVVGNPMSWFQGRVYAPSAVLSGRNDVTVFFAGYHTQKPKNGLGDYRTIGRFSMHSSRRLLGDVDDDDDR